jgi:hypothetical protein
MAEWWNGGQNGGMAERMARMVEWQEWLPTYSTIYGTHRHLVIYRCFGKTCWCWFLIPLAGMVEWQEWRDCQMAEWLNGKELLKWRECLPTYWRELRTDGIVKWWEWSNGRNGFIHTIYGTHRGHRH